MNRFKNGTGQHYIRELFYEHDRLPREASIYCLKDYDFTGTDGRVYPSLRKFYVELEDPTEYLFATQYLDNWAHWTKLRDANWFQPFLKDWREELDVRLRSKALVRLREKAMNPSDKESGQINKFLVQSGWKDTSSSAKAGRPTKAKIKEEAEKLFEQNSEHDADFKRLGLQ